MRRSPGLLRLSCRCHRRRGRASAGNPRRRRRTVDPRSAAGPYTLSPGGHVSLLRLLIELLIKIESLICETRFRTASYAARVAENVLRRCRDRLLLQSGAAEPRHAIGRQPADPRAGESL